jgi:putative oxidoreductase
MYQGLMIDYALLVLRFAAGIIFLAHGMQKLFGAFGGSGIKGFSDSLKGLGFSAPLFWAWVAALGEWLGGLFLLLGVIPRISAGVIAIIMIVAIIKVAGKKGFFMMDGGCEYQFFILMTCIALMLTGGGKFSLYDKW